MLIDIVEVYQCTVMSKYQTCSKPNDLDDLLLLQIHSYIPTYIYTYTHILTYMHTYILCKCSVILILSVSGGDTEGETGFQGCIRKLVIQGDPVLLTPDIKNVGSVVNGTCSVQDRSGYG